MRLGVRPPSWLVLPSWSFLGKVVFELWALFFFAQYNGDLLPPWEQINTTECITFSRTTYGGGQNIGNTVEKRD